MSCPCVMQKLDHWFNSYVHNYVDHSIVGVVKAFICSRLVPVCQTGHMLGGESYCRKANRVGALKMKGCNVPADVQISESNELSE